MADLSIQSAGLSFKNPVIVASSPLTAKIERIKKAEENGAAAVSLKHAMLRQQFAARPRWYAERHLGIVVSGDPRLEIDTARELIKKTKEETDLIVMVNMSALPTELDSWGRLARAFEEAGADAIELNLNCPNLHTAAATGPALGANLGSDPDSVALVTKAVKASVKIPVIAKLPTEGGRIMQVAAAAEAAGIDILNIHAGFRAAPGLDIYNEGAFQYPGSPAGNFGGSSGPWSRLISNRFIADIARASSVDVMGGGGMSEWEHVVESIMFGAKTVQICNAIMFEGFELIGTILKSMSGYMEEMGYQSIEDFRGKALKNILGPGQMKYTDVAASIEPAKCTGCKKCTKLPTCEAITYQDKKAKVNPEACVGCGLCACICPAKAISMVAL